MNFLTKHRKVLDQEVEEPTLLTLGLTVLGCTLLLGVSAVAMVGIPAFGYVGWTFVALTAMLGWLIWGLLSKAKAAPATATGRQWWFRRILRAGRFSFIGVFSCWLALFVWLAVCPGGPMPPAKGEPAQIRVVTWNIHCGQEEGPPWKQFDWPARKHALKMALNQVQPDILCVQEATPQQVAFLEHALPGHHHVGAGRDDGKSGGEHCAIYFRTERFEEIGTGTFWLEEPIDQPRIGSALDVKRICTWVRLRDGTNGRTLRVYNTHLYLTEAPRRAAARLILGQIVAGDHDDAVLLTADFNAGPTRPSRRLFTDAGLADSAALAGKPVDRPSFQLYGIGVSCLDGVLVDRHWRVYEHRILDVKPKNRFPSDHFGIMADIGWRD
jgi:endonuclease/exonuclease/phosphatase family metal-dependent hydrolase